MDILIWAGPWLLAGLAVPVVLALLLGRTGWPRRRVQRWAAAAIPALLLGWAGLILFDVLSGRCADFGCGIGVTAALLIAGLAVLTYALGMVLAGLALRGRTEPVE